MSSPRRAASRTPERLVNGHAPGTPNRTTPRSAARTPSRTPSRRTPARRRVAGTSERDVVPGSESNAGSRRSQIGSPSSPYRAGIVILSPRTILNLQSFLKHSSHATGISEFDLSSPMNYGTPSSVGSTRSGISGTPIRLRPDVRQQGSVRQLAFIPENEVRNNIFTATRYPQNLIISSFRMKTPALKVQKQIQALVT